MQTFKMSADGTARIWDAETRAAIAVLKGPDLEVVSAGHVVTAALDKSARIWDAETQAPITPLKAHHYMLSAAFSPDGRRVVTASVHGTARIWDAETQARIAVLRRRRRRRSRR